MTISRRSWALGAAGLVAGMALGVTSLATAAGQSPSPSPSQPSSGPDLKQRFERHGGPLGRFGDHFRGGYGGLVTAVDSDSLTVSTPRGTETIALNGSTAYYVGDTKATRSAISKGEIVHVRLADPQATKKVAAVVRVAPAHLEGWVTAVGDTSITITDVSGFTRSIHTTSATTYTKDGATATRSAITVGTLVHAVGQVDDDGTTLDATQVGTGFPGRAGRMMQPGMMGDGPDGPADAPVA